jgi:hypothetical protein
LKENREDGAQADRTGQMQTEQKKHEISTGYCGNRIDITGAADCRRNENYSEIYSE